MAAPRYIEKFESIDASISLTFPLFRYEYEASQPVAHASAPTAGATYDFDHLGLALAPLRNGAERIRFLLVGDEDDLDNDLDDIKSKLYLAGRGKLYLLDALGNRRWAYARIADMPGVTLTAGRHRILPVILGFERYSSWVGASASDSEGPITTASHTYDVENPGNAPVYPLIWFASLSAAGFSNLTLTNNRNGYSFSSTRDAASNQDVLAVHAGNVPIAGTSPVGYSTNGGASFINDFANFSRGGLRVAFFRLDPGTNELVATCAGTPNFQLDLFFNTRYL